MLRACISPRSRSSLTFSFQYPATRLRSRDTTRATVGRKLKSESDSALYSILMYQLSARTYSLSLLPRRFPPLPTTTRVAAFSLAPFATLASRLSARAKLQILQRRIFTKRVISLGIYRKIREAYRARNNSKK